MNEKVLNLLALCLQALEVNEIVNFEYHPGVNSVSIFAYTDYSQVAKVMAGEECPRKLDYYFYLDDDEEKVLDNIAKVEAEILKLIETAKAK